MEKEVSIIIVNYKTSSLVKKCVKSIIDKSNGFSYEIIIVDNSCDRAETMGLNEIKKMYRDCDISVLNADGNIGFGRANNLGSRYSQTRYLFFLNSDTILVNNAIFESLKYIKKNEKVGIVGSNLYKADMSPSHSFAKDARTIKNPILEIFPIELIKKIFHWKKSHNFTDKPMKISGYVSGAAFIISRNLFENVKGFSEDIFMYGEDVLLCGQVLRKGFLICNLPNSKIIHLEGKSDTEIYSSFKLSSYVNGCYICNRELYGEKNAKKYLFEQRIVFFIKSFALKIIGNKAGSINKKNLSLAFGAKYRELKKP